MCIVFLWKSANLSDFVLNFAVNVSKAVEFAPDMLRESRNLYWDERLLNLKTIYLSISRGKIKLKENF